jgi:hypothetical protein
VTQDQDAILKQVAEQLDRLLPALTLLIAASASTRWGARLVHVAWGALGRLVGGNRRGVGPLVVLVASLLVGLPLIVGREPQPRVHDEFSYLLAADTFARGRLTNPTPVGWPAFETMHVLMTPSYASKYPPGQGMLLALGQVLTGRPAAGAWLGAAIACAAVTWMLGARLPPRWAVIGGLLAATHPRVIYWGQSYWGGQLAMAGGALLLGAALRLARRGPDARLSAVAAVGVGLLAVSRPSEGGLFALAVAIWTLFRWRRLGRDANGTTDVAPVTVGDVLWRAAVPCAGVLIPLFAFLSYYNYRVTGSPVLPPYVEHIRQYGVAPPYVFQSARPEPAFRNAEVRGLQAVWEVDIWRAQQSLRGYAYGVASKLYSVLRDAVFIGAMPLALAAALASWRRDRRLRAAILGLAAFIGFVALIQTWTMVHYVAPAAGLLIFVAVAGVRHLRTWRPQFGVGARVGRVLVHAAVVVALLSAARYEVEAARSFGWQHDRRTLIRQLEERGGKHLVVVRYSQGHDMMREWVANSADIEEQGVVFCREVDADTMARVRGHFAARGRQVWLLEPDKDFFELVPYP